jgi:hypothetical protein
MAKEVLIETAIAAIAKLCESESVQKVICGTYSDGTPKSLPDAISGETISPGDKAKIEKKKKKKKKKKKRAKLKL